MSNILTVSAGELDYCPDCADIYGVLDGIGKRCNCERSSQTADLYIGGDFPTPFEICWYCQAEIIRSGSRWSTYYCENCRVPIRNLNDILERDGLVGLPIGRHTMMHARWPSARPMTAGQAVMRWKEARLREAWSSYEDGATTEWMGFSEHIRQDRNRREFEWVTELISRVQDTDVDWVTSMAREFNSSRRVPQVDD